MNKNIIAAAIFASLGAIAMPAQAIDLNKTAQGYVDFFASSQCNIEACDLNAALTTAISEFPIFAEPLLAAALKAVGPDTPAAAKLVATAVAALGEESTLTASLLESATEAGVNFETASTASKNIDSSIGEECQEPNLSVTETEECLANAALTAAIIADPTSAEALVAEAINAAGADSEAAETIIATAIAALGPDSPLIPSILTIATNAGVNSDIVTGIAIASGVDATIASEATAAGSGTTAGTNTVTTNRGGANNGGGGGGISDNQ